MKAKTKHHPYALRIPEPDARELAEGQRVTGQSINQLIMLCVRRALPEVLATFRATRRVTNIEALPASEWRKIYRRSDELENVSAKQLADFQSQETPE